MREQFRSFVLKYFITAASLFLIFTQFTRAEEQAPRPDILLLMPDQMRGDCLSALGHPSVRTPNFDSLAAEGTLFRRGYATVSSCIPARYALMSGLYPQTSGVVGFAAKPFSSPPMPKLLSEAGYTTVLVGRNMHQVGETRDCGYQQRILGSTYVADDDYDKFLKEEAPQSGGIRNVVKRLGVTYNHWQANPWNFADDLHPTAWIVGQSRKVLADTSVDKPLFLTTSFYAPHPPLFPPKKFWDRHIDSDLPAPAHGDWVKWDEITTGGKDGGHRVLLEGETLRRAMAGYFGLIEHIDEQIAPLIAEFKARSEKANRPWIILVVSDHGEMLGDHGYFRKCEPLEGGSNIPFIIAGSPQLGFQTGQRCNQPVCLEDVMPTLLALAGTTSPRPLDGVDLAPTLRGEKQIVRPWLHFEHSPCYSQAQAYHALTDGRYKYIWRPTTGQELLFDLQADPKEEHDLTKDPDAQPIVKKWRDTLIARLADRPEGFSDGEKLIPGCRYKALYNMK